MKRNLIKCFVNDEITQIPSLLANKYLPGLDGLRGLAIILVVISHIFKNIKWLDIFGEIGVNIFFVISGFLITTLLIKEKVITGSISLKNFYIRRFIRIIPVAYLFIFVLYVLKLTLSIKISDTSFITSLLFIKNIPFENASEWYSGHFWSLSIEEQFYLVFPFILAVNINRYSVLILISIIIITLLGFIAEHRIGVFYSNYILHAVTFTINSVFLGRGTSSILIGSLTAILVFKRIIVIEKLWNSFVFAAALLLISFVLYYQTLILSVSVSRMILSVLVSFIILINLQNKTNLLAMILDLAVLKKIGILSYSIYIWQQLFTFNQPWENESKYYLIFNLFFLILVSTGSYYLYEKQILKLKKRYQ